VLDVVVHAAERRRGHGRSMMLAAHRLLRERGVGSVGLSVFGWNHGARALYDELGYVEVERLVRKDLRPPERMATQQLVPG
jgi:ribosomal protein S18 acetylase RimI-like enzyme